MDTENLDDFMAVNDQLAALPLAGVPIEMGLSESCRIAPHLLEQINAAVARRVSRGQSLTDMLAHDEQSAPSEYRNLILLGLGCRDFTAALDSSNRLAQVSEGSRQDLRSAFFYPLVLCTLVYLGLIALCLYFVPALEGMFNSFRVPLAPGTTLLSRLRNALPYWVAIPPLLLLSYLAVGRLRQRISRPSSQKRTRLLWLPATVSAAHHQRCANFATTLASLLQNDAPFDEALLLAANASGEPDLSRAARSIVNRLQLDQPPDGSEEEFRIPPFLRWALLQSEQIMERDRALQIAASIYQDSARRHADFLRVVVPVMAMVIIGGGVTLLYGLALFEPFVEMLRAISN